MAQSAKRTTVAVLRNMLGLSVAEFAKVIGRQVPTVQSLESGRLKLSEKTAQQIALATGIDTAWLLDGDLTAKPVSHWAGNDGHPIPYSRTVFELSQSANDESRARYAVTDLSHAQIQIEAISSALDWFPILASAHKRGEGALAIFALREHLRALQKRYGRDDDAAAEVNDKAVFIPADRSARFTFKYGKDSAAELIEADKTKITVLPEAEQKRTPPWAAALALRKAVAPIADKPAPIASLLGSLPEDYFDALPHDQSETEPAQTDEGGTMGALKAALRHYT